MNDPIVNAGYKHPVRNINPEILDRLTLEDAKIYPLPGATGRRPTGAPDPRLSQLQGSQPDEVCFYEHVATIRYHDPNSPNKDTFFVAFRQTMDALLLEQQDPEKYPEWLMKDPVKRTELAVFIYMVTKHPKQVPVLRSHEDWLAHVADPMMFDTLAHFLLKQKVITQEMYGKI